MLFCYDGYGFLTDTKLFSLLVTIKINIHPFVVAFGQPVVDFTPTDVWDIDVGVERKGPTGCDG
jgi:hypothetical protein